MFFIDQRFIKKVFLLNELGQKVVVGAVKDEVLSVIVMICEAFTQCLALLY